jgi:uncharacterized protein YqeY
VTDAAIPMKARLRSDLRDAMRRGSRREVALLRELIAAIDNAEAVPQAAAPGSPPGHAFGSGAAEVPRLRLTADAVHALLRREIATRERAAAELESLGEAGRAARARADALTAKRYLAG